MRGGYKSDLNTQVVLDNFFTEVDKIKAAKDAQDKEVELWNQNRLVNAAIKDLVATPLSI